MAMYKTWLKPIEERELKPVEEPAIISPTPQSEATEPPPKEEEKAPEDEEKKGYQLRMILQTWISFGTAEVAPRAKDLLLYSDYRFCFANLICKRLAHAFALRYRVQHFSKAPVHG